ncbi:MAG: hypothetical protein ACK4UJ_10515 [Leptonema sp. (in: bacteria)]
MRKFIKFFLLYTILSHSVFSVDISEPSIKEFLEKDSESRRKSLWIIYQTKQFELLKQEILKLPQINNEEEEKLILRILKLLDEDLEIIIPNWYRILDRYTDIKKPKENLLIVIELAQKFKEKKLTPTLLRLTNHPSFEIRREAIQSLKILQSDRIYPTIINFLKAKDDLLNIYGLELIQSFPDERMIPFIKDLSLHPNKIIKIYSFYALAEYEKESYFIIKNLTNEKDEDIISHIIHIIGEKGWNSYHYLIQQNISSENKKIRKSAILAAKKLSDSRFSYTISKQLLIESEPEMIQEGIFALLELKKGDPFHSLVFLLNHKNPKIKFLALKAIRTLKLETYIEDLIEFLKKEKDKDIHFEITYTIADLINFKNYKILLNSLTNINESLSIEEKYLLFSSLKTFSTEEEIFYVKSNLQILEHL